MLPTEEIDCGLWPTPMARDWKGGRTAETLKKRGRSITNSLPDAVTGQLWPTPTANEDHAGRPGGKMQKMLGNHPEVRGTTEAEWRRGSLNPTWVEWLMGYPKGWTDLED
jgi:DNA (cytosine-5)-methyltransferase 1